jgi:hypothetical protein
MILFGSLVGIDVSEWADRRRIMKYEDRHHRWRLCRQRERRLEISLVFGQYLKISKLDVFFSSDINTSPVISDDVAI